MAKTQTVLKLPILPFFRPKLEEEPRSYVILRDHNRQVRKYRPFIVAETFVSGPDDRSLLLAFQRLYRYVRGKNSSGEFLKFHFPILFRQGQTLYGEVEDTAEGWSMGLIVSSDKKFSPPVPLATKIRLETVPSLYVATIRYNGVNSPERIKEKSSELLTWAQSLKDFQVVSSPRCAQYGGRFLLPIFRRNEIQLTLKEIQLTRGHKRRH